MRIKHFAMKIWGENMLYSHENNVKVGQIVMILKMHSWSLCKI